MSHPRRSIERAPTASRRWRQGLPSASSGNTGKANPGLPVRGIGFEACLGAAQRLVVQLLIVLDDAFQRRIGHIAIPYRQPQPQRRQDAGQPTVAILKRVNGQQYDDKDGNDEQRVLSAHPQVPGSSPGCGATNKGHADHMIDNVGRRHTCRLCSEVVFHRRDPASVEIEEAQIEVHEAHLSDAFNVFLDAGLRPREYLTPIDLLAARANAAALRHHHVVITHRILHRQTRSKGLYSCAGRFIPKDLCASRIVLIVREFSFAISQVSVVLAYSNAFTLVSACIRNAIRFLFQSGNSKSGQT